MKTSDFTRAMVRTMALILVFSSIVTSWYRSEFIAYTERIQMKLDSLQQVVESTRTEIEAATAREEGSRPPPVLSKPWRHTADIKTLLSQTHYLGLTLAAFWIAVFILIFIWPGGLSGPLGQNMPDLLDSMAATRIVLRLAGIYEMALGVLLTSGIAVSNLWFASAKFNLSSFWPCLIPFGLGLVTLMLNKPFAQLVSRKASGP